MAKETAITNVHLPDVLAAGMSSCVGRGAAPDNDSSRSLRRGLTLLDAVLDAGSDGIRVVDLCRSSGLERGTVHRLLSALIGSGYVMSLTRFRYGPGTRFATLVPRRAVPNTAIRLQPVQARVSGVSGDSAFAVVRQGPLSACIARQVGTHPVQVLSIQVGTRQPLGVGAAGLALLSALPAPDVASVIAANAPSLAAYGGMTPERMHLLVRATQERGWSVIGNHATRDVLAVGMAVTDAHGQPMAAVSIASTAIRMPRQRQQQIARWIREALADLLADGL
jgi:DNA-binding IclR family transcriptional regulator